MANPPPPQALIERRSVYLYTFFPFALCALMGRLFYIQGLQHDEIGQRALAQQTRTVDPSTLRGASRDHQGLAGVEYAYNSVLSGPHQHLSVFSDAQGHELLRDNDDSPLDSLQTQRRQVVLTLDETIQHITERELATGMAMTGALRGLAI